MKFVINHPIRVALFYIVIFFALIPKVFLLQNNNAPEAFFTQDASAIRKYEEFVKNFPGGQALRIAIGGENLWSKEGLTWLGDFEKAISELQQVETVIGLAAQYRWISLEWPPDDINHFKSQVVRESSDFGSGWVSHQGETITTLVVFKPLNPKEQRSLLSQLEGLLNQAPIGIKTGLSGLPIFHMAMDRSLVKMISYFLPFLVLVSFLFLWIILRRFWDVWVPILFVLVFHGILLGIMGYLEVQFNLVSIILIPLLFVISLATSIHILMHFRKILQPKMKVKYSVLKTFNEKSKPVLWTGLTTMVAFGSLMSVNIPPLRFVGMWAGIGILLMTIMMFTFYPVLLLMLPEMKAKKSKSIFINWARKKGFLWAQVSIKWRSLILIVVIFLGVISLGGLLRIKVDDNIGRYFPRNHPVRRELETLEKKGIGVFAAELIICRCRSIKSLDRNEGVKSIGFHNPADQCVLAFLTSKIRNMPKLYGAFSSGDLLEATIKSLLIEGEINEKIRWLTLGLLQSIPESRQLYNSMISKDGKYARVTLLLPMLSFNQLQPLFQRIKTQAQKKFPNSEIWITGQFPLILLAQNVLLKGLLLSLSITLFIVALIFRIILGSLRLTLLILVPNLLPILLVLGGMGWLRIPLDSASVMTVSIVLGLAVDDTFHTLGFFLHQVKGKGFNQAIEMTMANTAPAHILTTIVLVAGFATCSFSDLLPVSRMGVLSALAIFFALMGDLLVIPAILTKSRRCV